MSLLEDLTEYGKTMRYPDPQGDGVDCVCVSDEIVDTSRWAVIHHAVYQRKNHSVDDSGKVTLTDEFVQMVYREPATESQDWGDEGPPSLYEVEPVEVTVTQYRRK